MESTETKKPLPLTALNPRDEEGSPFATAEVIAAFASFTSILLHELREPRKRRKCVALLEQHNPRFATIMRAHNRMQRGIGGDL
jgi:hypothetical protein